ncbi:glycogen synthase [Patescibacteria group bacterium]|nr:glycogen synthase [Patescibacteria group bacterium]
MTKIKVLFVSAELTPIAKVGGLGDVAGALPKALHQLGVDVRIALPKYGIVDEKKYPLKKIAQDVSIPYNQAEEKINIYETPLPGSEVPVYLIDSKKYLGDNGIYFETDASSGGTDREAERFTFLARSSLGIFEVLNWYPNIVHCQDWHAGMIPVILKVLAKNNPKLANVKTQLTIHNLEYQGWYNADTILNVLGFSAYDHPTLSKLKGDTISSLQQAIYNADQLNTVSPTYAKEILTVEYGAGLEKDLQTRKDDLVGILNGIDVDRFNPANDKDIAAKFSSDNLSGKAKCKEDLQKLCNLPVDKKIPVVGIVSRLTGQKGIDLINEIADNLANEQAQFVLLGTGDPVLEKMMQKIGSKYPEKMHVKIEFNAKVAQQIYAGSDIFLMPSRFEPCGLAQMISMLYGTVPVVRATGGLKDTVKDYNPSTGKGDGFVFEKYDSQEFWQAIIRALQLYKEQEKWYNMVTSIMKKDFSWNASAKKYIKLYEKLLK